jgi:hypothetical protein
VINKENDKEKPETEPKKESGFIDIAMMEVQCHLLIKDKETGEVLVNKRG